MKDWDPRVGVSAVDCLLVARLITFRIRRSYQSLASSMVYIEVAVEEGRVMSREAIGGKSGRTREPHMY